MAEYSANAVQTVAAGQSIVFTTAPSPCRRGFVRHRNDSGAFLLSGWTPRRSCRCNCNSAEYLIDFGANIAIPTGGTVGPISLAITIDGVTIPSSQMIVTPAAVNEFFNVSRAITVPVWQNCCQTISITNTGAEPILVENANLLITRPDLNVTY